MRNYRPVNKPKDTFLEHYISKKYHNTNVTNKIDGLNIQVTTKDNTHNITHTYYKDSIYS